MRALGQVLDIKLGLHKYHLLSSLCLVGLTVWVALSRF